MMRFRYNMVWILSITILLAGCGKKGFDYPVLENPNAFEMSSQIEDIEIGEKTYTIEYGTFYVPENRSSSQKLIGLPYKIYYSSKKSTNAPIAHLAGGPGQTNLSMTPPQWLLDEYNIIFLGYRGVDGDEILETPQFNKALKNLEGNPISKKNLQIAGKALSADYYTLGNKGVHLPSYTIIDVMDDLADFQMAKGIESINLWSASYGTRVAYYYGLTYPENMNRSLMVSVNPPGGFIWELPYIQRGFEHYDGLDETRDIPKLMNSVLNNLPDRWFLFPLQRQRIESVAFFSLFHRGDGTPSAAQVFDAFSAAEKGDYSGLAVMSVFYDFVVPSLGTWGEFFMKGGSADYEDNRNYRRELYDENRMYNSPFSAFIWGLSQEMDFQWPLIPEFYRTPQSTDVETLMVSGNVDFSTPADLATEQLLPLMSRGQQVILKEFGHVNDVMTLQPDAFAHLALSFFDKGIVDDSQFEYEPMNFIPSMTFQRMGKMVRAIIIALPLAVTVVIALIVIIRKRRIKSQRS